MGCGMSFVKYLLFIFNLVFALSGLALLVLGILVLTETEVYQEFLAGKFHAPPILLIVIGCIVFVVAFLGCCGAIRESHCMVITFAIFLLTIFIFEIVVGALAFVYSNDTQDVLDDSLNKIMEDYKAGNQEANKTMNTIQDALKCCGYKGPDDYPGMLPKTCCVISEHECPNHLGSKVHYTIGCSEALKQFVKDSGIVLGGVAIGFAFIELVGIVFALCLANTIKNNSRRRAV
ncbi:23 kDa integral membrane protein [Anabrus simplex]|uniref:23 kDa integral membrane protein n=1 Tax=Anabrus simplex TaxID=316456 RepID=UPI0034DCCA4B